MQNLSDAHRLPQRNTPIAGTDLICHRRLFSSICGMFCCASDRNSSGDRGDADSLIHTSDLSRPAQKKPIHNEEVVVDGDGKSDLEVQIGATTMNLRRQRTVMTRMQVHILKQPRHATGKTTIVMGTWMKEVPPMSWCCTQMQTKMDMVMLPLLKMLSVETIAMIQMLLWDKMILMGMVIPPVRGIVETMIHR